MKGRLEGHTGQTQQAVSSGTHVRNPCRQGHKAASKPKGGAISLTLSSMLACRSTPPAWQPLAAPCPTHQLGITQSHWAVPKPRTSGTSPLLSSGRGQLPKVDGRERPCSAPRRNTV